MRFYTTTHNHYCGIDLHAKTMYLCILDREGEIVLHKNMRSRPEEFLAAVEPFRDDLVVADDLKMTWAVRRASAEGASPENQSNFEKKNGADDPI